MIQLDRVTKRFDSKEGVVALADVSLTIPAGQMVSIIGPSGSGKSTLLNLVGGLDRPTSGDIQVGGESLAKLSDDALTLVRRDKIGFIFQFFGHRHHDAKVAKSGECTSNSGTVESPRT